MQAQWSWVPDAVHFFLTAILRMIPWTSAISLTQVFCQQSIVSMSFGTITLNLGSAVPLIMPNSVLMLSPMAIHASCQSGIPLLEV